MPDAAQAAPRRGRWFVLAALVLGLAVVLFAIVELSTEEGGETRFEIDGINEAQRYFGGVPQSGTRFGSDDAPVEVIVFDDVQCADCAEHFAATIPPLAEGPVRDGEVKLEYRHYSFSARVEQLGFFAAMAAGEQNYQWHFLYLFFRNQDDAERLGVTEDLMRNLAGSVGELEVPRWEEDFGDALESDSEIRAELADSEALARQLGIRAEPAMLVVGPDGERVLLQDSPGIKQVETAIEQVR